MKKNKPTRKKKKKTGKTLPNNRYSSIQKTARFLGWLYKYLPNNIAYSKHNKTLLKWYTRAANTLFIITAFAFFVNHRTIQNTINSTQLFFIALAVGILVGAMVITVVTKLARGIFYNKDKALLVLTNLFITSCFLVITASYLINKHFANTNLVCNYYTVVYKYENDDAYYFKLQLTPTNTKKFAVPATTFDKYNEGNIVELCTFKGALGYTVAKKIN